VVTVVMGIRSLTTYMWQHEDERVFSDLTLSDCDLVLDGNNLRYVLYAACPRLYSGFGGDYARYADFVDAFFHKFAECRISCHVVLDGAYHGSAIKKRTVMNRMRDQAKTATFHTRANHHERLNVMPLFARDVFVERCRRAAAVVAVKQTPFEADADMAALAVELKCPIASNDSDFFVNDVTFVPLDSLVSAEPSTDASDGGVRRLACKRFDRRAFMERYGIRDARLLHLMSAVLGNDYVPAATFERFFANGVSLPKRKNLSQRHRVIAGFLAWLGREKDCESAKRRILQTIPSERREALEAKIEASMSMTASYGVAEVVPDAPAWLLEEYKCALLASWTMDAWCNGEVFFQSQIEDGESPSSHLAAEPALKTTLGLLLAAKEAGLPAKVSVFLREGRTVKPITWTLRQDLRSLNDWRNTPTKEREEFLLATTGLSASLVESLRDDVREELRLFTASLAWLADDIVLKTEDLHAFAVLLCLQHLLGDVRLPVEIEQSESNATAADKARKRLRARWPNAAARRKSKDDILAFTRRVLSPFQAKLYHLSHLAALLGLSHLLPDTCTLLEGTVLNNARYDLEAGSAGLKTAMGDVLGVEAVIDFLARFVIIRANTMPKVKKKGKKQPKEVLADLGNRFALLVVE